MQDKRKVGHSSMAIASSAKEREGGRKGQDVLWVWQRPLEEGVASECYGSARAREMVVDSAVVAVFALSTGVCGRVRPSRRDGNRRGGAAVGWRGRLAGESRFAID